MRRWVWIVMSLLGLVLGMQAQRYSFAAYGQADGLDNLNVNSIVEDSSGLLWAGTENGLFRFEAGRFRAYGRAQGLRNVFIYGLHLTPGGQLMVGTDDGLFISTAPASQGSVQFIKVPGAANDKGIGPDAGFADRPDGSILVVSGIGLLQVDRSGPGGAWRARDYFQVHPNPVVQKMNLIRGVLTTAAGDLWLGCGRGLCRIANGGTTVWGPEQGVPFGAWLEMMEARDGTLWARDANHILALPPGATRFEIRENGLPPVRANDGYWEMVEDPQGRILTPMARGIARWTPSRAGGPAAWRIFDSSQGLAPASLTDIAVDRQGQIWMGLAGHGLARWLGYGDWESWTTDDGLASSTTWAVLQSAPDTVWVASEQGVDRINPLTGKLQPFDALGADGRQAVRFVQQTTDGHVWFVNRSGAVDEFDPKSQSLRRYPRLLSGHILDAMADRENHLWIASSTGLFVIHGDRGDRWTQIQDSGFDTSFFYAIEQSAAGELWCSGRTGLFHFHDGHWHKIDLGKAPLDPRFELLVPRDDGTVWVSNYVTALDRFWIAGDRLTRYVAVDPPVVASNEVVSLTTGPRGWIWVGTDHGVDVYDGHAWRQATTDDGLLWNDLDDHAMSVARNGTVWFGTSAGISHLKDPQSLYAPEPLRARITLLQLDGHDLLNDLASRNGRLAWINAPLVAQFTASGAPSEKSLRYRYRLHGMENDWTATEVGQARYASLPPGNYTFEVSVEDTARHVRSAPASVTLELTPPWWRTWLFRFALAILLVVIAGQFLRWRERILMQRQRGLEALVAERTRELEMEKSELEAARAALHVQATRDGLTGLWNRTAILGQLAAELERSGRERTRLAVVLVDLDHFKSVNDRYGHLPGDSVLQEAARRFAAAARPYDSVGRYGGEEFLMVFPGLDEQDGARRLEDMHGVISAEPFMLGDAALHLTCSFGVAWVQGGGELEAVLEAADHALYVAKSLGRDRIEYAPMSA
ncbi:MAG TPA: diguanylate cyclase [Terriglobales bacterium]|nr:diguanylate cyclase [Terriglobales bacterium]